MASQTLGVGFKVHHEREEGKGVPVPTPKVEGATHRVRGHLHRVLGHLHRVGASRTTCGFAQALGAGCGYSAWVRARSWCDGRWQRVGARASLVGPGAQQVSRRLDVRA